MTSMNDRRQRAGDNSWSCGRWLPHAGVLLAAMAVANVALGQELEPRRWAHLPIGTNFAGLAQIWTEGEIAFDPVLRIEDGSFELQTSALKYIHSFELLDKSARFELTQAYQQGTWSGLLNGAQTSVDRSGWSDTALRFAINLYGAPPLKGKEFAAYRAEVAGCETIIGAGFAVVLPTGEYFEERLINLGSNRFTFRPQVGVIHTRGPWSAELSGAIWFFTGNDEFWNGNRVEQDPLLALQGHLVHTFRPGLWAGTSVGYGAGGRSTVNGAAKNDRRNQFSWAISLGVPVNRQVGLKLSYISSRTMERIGSESDTLAVAVTAAW